MQKAKQLPLPLLLLLTAAVAMAVEVSEAEPSETSTAVYSSTSAAETSTSTIGRQPEERTQSADTATPPMMDNYNVIDVQAASNAAPGKANSGQTTRIYTSGEVNDDFWLKHLGEDFKHAILLQVGGTNEEYNQLLNETQNGLHEVVQHDYLPGAERPSTADNAVAGDTIAPAADMYNPAPIISQLGLQAKVLGLRQLYHQPPQLDSFIQAPPEPPALPQLTSYMPHHNTLTQSYTHTHTHTGKRTHQDKHLHLQQHNHKPLNKEAHKKWHKPQQPHVSQTQVTAAQSRQAGSSMHTSEDAALQSPPAAVNTDTAADDTPNPLPFKSPFNDYGNRPNRDAATENF